MADPLVSGIARKQRLLALLTPLLGEDIVLWGCKVARRTPGQVHPWHVDIETSPPGGRFATVWIGLENTTKESGLRLIAGSHLCGSTVQQFAAENGSDRNASTEIVLEWARSANKDASVVSPDVSDGDAIIFDGKLWHGSDNQQERIRHALLLQYASADTLVRTHDERVLNWPFRYLEAPPPVLLVQGSPDKVVNPLMPQPQPASKPAPLSSSIRKLQLPLAEDPVRKWQPYPMFRGSTPALASMSCHVSVLSPGHSPHPPHAHGDEELLMILHGDAELLLASRPQYEGARPVPVTAGDFAYYPAGQHHTLRNVSSSPVTYVMFRWHGRSPLGQSLLRPTLVRAPARADAVEGKRFVTRRVLDAPTRWLRKLHCHMTRMEVGAGYAPHADPYDVAILVQSGRLQTLGQEVGPGSLIYYPAGKLHGMRNVGDEAAHYIVFEFHGDALRASGPLQADAATALQ